MHYISWLLIGMLVGATLARLIGTMLAGLRGDANSNVASLVAKHLRPTEIANISISKRQFPYRVRADLQQAIDSMLESQLLVHHFSGVRTEYGYRSPSMTDCLFDSAQNAAYAIPPEYEDLDVGEEFPVRVLNVALWLVESDGYRFAIMLSPFSGRMEVTGIQIEIAAPNDAKGVNMAKTIFKVLEDAVTQGKTYRGKILSLQKSDHSYSGMSAGITVHQLKQVQREEVILPEATLELLERNVINFAKNRSRLAMTGLSKKKGLLFYGPPGTGKTHTLHHLANALTGHTTFIITAEQVGLLAEYMTLARLLQPSIVLIEDVDLIARNRDTMNSPCEEVLLNKLLNEMDGLTEDADIFFILTTNRPEALEGALAARPGRIDQAIEFPLPDAAGRLKLIKLYAPRIDLDEQLLETTVKRTEGVSAAFLKELMRRATQYAIERNGALDLTEADLDAALNEMLVKGGLINRKLLGAQEM